jgi:Chemotaxis protein histidine kinase and related kinases
MMIEDEELRSLYQIASSEHLANLEAGLLFLEKNPQDKTKLQEMLRSAHSLKGDSRMLGVKDAETLTHNFEDILSKIHKGESTLTPSILEVLLKALDGIKRIANEAVTGKPAEVSVFHLVAEMMTAMEDQSADDLSLLLTPDVEEKTIDFPTKSVELESLDIPVPSVVSEPSPVLAPAETEQSSDIIRVKASKLDALMQYATEIAVIQQRLHRQLGLISQNNNLWEDTDQTRQVV